MATIPTSQPRKFVAAALAWAACIAIVFSATATAQTRQRETTRGTYAPPVLESGTAPATKLQSSPVANSHRASEPTRQPAAPEVVRQVDYEVIELSQEPSVLDMGPDYGSPGCDSGGYCDSMGGGCCGSPTCGGCGPTVCNPCFGYGMPCQRLFGSLEYSMYWRRGQTLPPLVTSSPGTTAVGVAGELGQATTTILVGGLTRGEMTSGGRAQLGIWMDDFQCRSILLRFWGVGDETFDYSFADDGSGDYLAVPFNNAGLNNEADAFLIVEPNETTGSINIQTRSEAYGGDALLRQKWRTGLGGRVDAFWGYQTARINESLTMSVDSLGLDGGTRAGQRLQITDSFQAKNEFHGATFGFDSFYREGCWSWTMLTKIGFGSMHREAAIRGNTVRTSGGIEALSDEGFFARNSNIGDTSSSKFSVAPEFDLKLGYAVCPGVDLSIGYSFQLFTNVVQPSGIMDTTTTDLSTTSTSHPIVKFDDTSYWIQALNFGLAWNY
ncbi:hypothetical protein Poly24_30960 [Rosistilla carotiformis]|uniref:Uncharacterized protein n=1 Tax=Rosistilla carotiformis TaxID=2528017 RepID=A0A518JUZ8_9BACT|nr:BBP7 family outer membrane beta-barrel protein [Rosistilla carotiformis]QDV69381.1 hypothetical protein Poly24_30960 [Rosistilla carotiformis]